jgi:hypothetical protein
MDARQRAEPWARDRLGRPIPDDSPERADHGVAVDEPRGPHDTVTTAERLLARGFPFAAHEVFEARWKACTPEERELWQGLAQWCVAITHDARGNAVGAERLRRRSLAHLTTPEATAAAARLGMDLSPLTAWLDKPAAELPTLGVPPTGNSP